MIKFNASSVLSPLLLNLRQPVGHMPLPRLKTGSRSTCIIPVHAVLNRPGIRPEAVPSRPSVAPHNQSRLTDNHWPNRLLGFLLCHAFSPDEPKSFTRIHNHQPTKLYASFQTRFKRPQYPKFRASAAAWERGNNSGDPEVFRAQTARERRLAREGEAMLAPLGIKCDWPGLYPSFQVNGFHEYSTSAAVLAALRHPRNWLTKEVV